MAKPQSAKGSDPFGSAFPDAFQTLRQRGLTPPSPSETGSLRPKPGVFADFAANPKWKPPVPRAILRADPAPGAVKVTGPADRRFALPSSFARPDDPDRESCRCEWPSPTLLRGARTAMFLLFGELEGNGRYYGSDGLRSPLDRYRSPGSPGYRDDT